MGSPFIYLEPVVPPIFAGRSKEMQKIHDSLFIENENLVIYGNDAIGKSSIIGTFYTNQILKQNSKIFPVRINAFDFINSVDSNFLGVTTHQICAAIWTRLMNHKYSDLLDDSLFSVQKGVFKSDQERSIKKIFKLVSSEKYTETDKYNNELGAKFFVEGKAGQEYEMVNERKPLAPFEFIYLLDELNDIIKLYDYESIIILCDELNHFPKQTNTEILRNYFSIFQSKKIQFFIVLVNPDTLFKDDATRLLESFNCKIEIGTFKQVSDVKELIENTINTSTHKTVFETSSIELLFHKTGGHPWWIQKICDRAFDQSTNEKLNTINDEMIESKIKEFQEEIDIYEYKIKMGLPFRKANLFK